MHNSCLEACQGETSQAELLMLMRIAEFFVVLQLLTTTKKEVAKKIHIFVLFRTTKNTGVKFVFTQNKEAWTRVRLSSTGTPVQE